MRWTIAVWGLALVSCATSQPRGRSPLLPRDRGYINSLVAAAAARHGVDPSLVRGVIAVESSYQVSARSSVGARGLMQLMPRTAASLARRLGWDDPDIEDPAFNVEAGTTYLAVLLERFDGDERLALAAYNTGPARVRRWVVRRQPLPTYSKRYVAAVMNARARLADGADGSTTDEVIQDTFDRDGLRSLLRERLYGPRPDIPVED